MRRAAALADGRRLAGRLGLRQARRDLWLRGGRGRRIRRRAGAAPELLADAEPVVVLVVGDGQPGAAPRRRATSTTGPKPSTAPSSRRSRPAKPDDLAGLDLALAAELLAAGTPAWAAFGAPLGRPGFGRFAADVLYADAPLGVGYPVAVWTPPSGCGLLDDRRCRRPHRDRQVRSRRRPCRCLGAEIVNADSMQLYAGMDIGTAKLPVDGTARGAAPPARHLAGHQVGGGGRVPAARARGHRRDPPPRPAGRAGRRIRAVHPGRPGSPRLSGRVTGDPRPADR